MPYQDMVQAEMPGSMTMPAMPSNMPEVDMSNSMQMSMPVSPNGQGMMYTDMNMQMMAPQGQVQQWSNGQQGQNQYVNVPMPMMMPQMPQMVPVPVPMAMPGQMPMQYYMLPKGAEQAEEAPK